MEHFLSKNFGINNYIASCFLAIVCYFVLLKNIEYITKINSVIVPVLVLIIIIIGIKNILNLDVSQIGENIQVDTSFYWIVQSVIYASYNLILVVPVLITLKKLIKNKKQIFLVSIITSIIITIISILTFLLLINVDINFSSLEMPILYAIEKNFIQFKFIYGLIILVAIFTTAISVGVSFLNNICKNKKNYPQIVAIMCIISLIISPIGFSNLVKILFSLFGYLGLIQICFITIAT